MTNSRVHSGVQSGSRLFRTGAGGFRVLVVGLLLLAEQSVYAGDLHEAAKAGSSKDVKDWLARSTGVDSTDGHGRTPLWYSCGAGHRRIVEWLLEAGADPERRDRFGVSPLVVSLRREHADVVNVLVARGVDVNPAPRDRFVPLHIAVEQGRRDLVVTLLAAGADPLLQVETGDSGTDITRNTMIRGRIRGMVQRAIWMIDRVVPTTIFLPVSQKQDSALVEITQDGRMIHSTLIREGLVPPRVGVVWNLVDDSDEAVGEGRYTVIARFSDGSRDSAIFVATMGLIGTAIYGDPEVLRSMLSAGGDPNTSDQQGRTVLMLSAAFGADASTATLLAAGADPHTRDPEGRTALDYADLYAPNQSVGVLIRNAIEGSTISR